MFIGNTPSNQAYAPQVAYFSGNASTTAFTLPQPVASVAQLIVVVANVVQNPSSAYTVSGSTITFTSAPPTGTNNIWVEYTSLITQIIAPSPGTVGTSQLGTITNINSAASNLTLQTNSTTAVTIDTAQNVGIGITPSAWGANRPTIELGGSVQGNLAFNGNNANGGFIQYNWYYNGSNSVYKFNGYACAYGIGSSGQHIWYNAPSGTANATISYTQAMILDNSGTLIVGGTSAISSGGVSIYTIPGTNNALNIKPTTNNNYTAVQFYNSSGSGVGSITYNGTLVVYATTSDRRLKSNIQDLTTDDSGILIDSLKPRKFTWIDSNQSDVGFIADEVQNVLPSAVIGNANATKEEEYEVTPAIKDEQGNITIPAVMGKRTIPDYQMVDMSIPEMTAHLIAEVKSLRARLKAANIA